MERLKVDFFEKKNAKDEYIAEVELHYDQDGNRFRARQFGDAGIWMLDNMRATKLADGTLLNNEGTTATDNVYFAYTYPNKSKAYFDANPSIGLLYDWHAATNYKDGNAASTTPGAMDANGIEISKHKLGIHLQGICPNGWHLPTAAEWIELEKEIITNSSLYSSQTSIPEPSPALDPDNPFTTENKYFYVRGVHGLAMRSACNPPDVTATTSNATGKTVYEGGFSAYLTGFLFGDVNSYGRLISFISNTTERTSSSSLAGYVAFQINTEGEIGVYRRYIGSGGGTNGGYLPVRCKKD